MTERVSGTMLSGWPGVCICNSKPTGGSARVCGIDVARDRTGAARQVGALLEAHAHDVYAFAGARCDAVVHHVLTQLQQQGRIHRPEGPG